MKWWLWFRRKPKASPPPPRRSRRPYPVQAPAYDMAPVLTTFAPDKISLEDFSVAINVFRDTYGHYATKVLLVDENSDGREAAMWIVP